MPTMAPDRNSNELVALHDISFVASICVTPATSPIRLAAYFPMALILRMALMRGSLLLQIDV